MMNDKKRILFVDDEQNVLDGLRRMLRPMRSAWEMAFATSGQEALVILGQEQFDLVVADMRMPGMSGQELLREVRTRHPHIVRIVLSGEADRDSILASVGPVHQFLQKPCDETEIRSTILRTLELGQLFTDDELRRDVSSIETLPSISAHQREVASLLRTPDVSPNRVGEAMSKDVAMCAKILQLVNSAFFGLRRRITCPAESVTLLGLDVIRSLVTSMQLFGRIPTGRVSGFSEEVLLAHSATVATIASKIARAEGMEKERVAQVYLAGLLHDVGKLAFASIRPDQFAEAIALAGNEGIEHHESEKQVIGASHAEVGGFLLGLWGFDAAIVDAAMYHHAPDRHGSEHFSVITAVHIANALSRHDPEGEQPGKPPININYVQRLGLGDRIDAWTDFARKAA